MTTAWTPLPSASTEASQAALNPETNQHLHNTLRALPRPLLESLTRAFRKRFQVPDTAVTIADRINQKCHHDWIEAFFVSHREVRSAEQHREVRSAEQHREVRSAEQHREVRSAEQHREVRSAEQHREVRSAEQHREVRSAEQHQGAST